MTPAVLRPLFWTSAGVVWLTCVVAGLAVLMNYDNRPGPSADAPRHWPVASRLPRDADGPTLLMLAHPRCDCTRASLAELAEVLARAQRRPRTVVVFIRPGRVEGGWEQTALWRIAGAIPGVTVVRDDEAVEAQRFGVQTSGQVLLYDRGGQLLYSGGATGARGKTGANAGRDALIAALDGRDGYRPTAPVFGCSLIGPADGPVEAAMSTHEPASR
jgi:hypothetical protein